ncbi:MAG: thiol-disulfide oxidoreductase DCC family protein [Saprospiraceae bacterium]|nr:thiol-disulfide oxidoreductase DCC family protein [Saprospiraceae bacterium]
MKRNESDNSTLDSPVVDFTSPQAVVLFDGVCNFCNATVRFIIDRDKKNTFNFSSIQSNAGAALLAEHNAPSDLSTIVLIENGQVYLRSTAVLRIARRLIFPYKLAYIFILIPAFIRDFFYKQFAQRRYQWFGQKDVCEIPPIAIRTRFLD